MAARSPTARSINGRLGAYTRLARANDPRELTRAATAGLLEKFRRLADPDGSLPEQERHERAVELRRAYYLGLAAKSAAARAPRRKAQAVST